MISVKLMLSPYPNTSVASRRRYCDDARNLADSIIDGFVFFTFFGASLLFGVFEDGELSDFSMNEVLK